MLASSATCAFSCAWPPFPMHDRFLSSTGNPMSNAPSLTDLEQTDDFIRRHIGPDAAEQQAMLETLEVGSLDELIGQTVPGSILRTDPLDMASPRSEAE